MGLKGIKDAADLHARFEKGYWIYVSRIEHPAKNHIGLVKAYELLVKEDAAIPDLVCAGGNWDGSYAVHEYHAQSPAKDRIHFLGFVSDEDLPGWVANAAAYVYPSLYEGFGIPVIEAMACGVPVACSNTSSFLEVVGDAAILFDPDNSEDIAAALRRLNSDPNLRAHLVSRGFRRAEMFTWRACAEMTLAEICKTAEAR